jgi:5-methylcytosine-specific restriction endonuclease McrA
VLHRHYIPKSAGLEGQRAFQMSRFVHLRDAKIILSSTILEWLREHEKPDECNYCGTKGLLTVEHIFPRSCSGPDIPDNASACLQVA